VDTSNPKCSPIKPFLSTSGNTLVSSSGTN
jgi:hypothetical protein